MTPLRCPAVPFRCYASGMESAAVNLIYAVEVAEAGVAHTEFVRACSIDAAIAEAAPANEAVLSVHLAVEVAPGEYRLGQELPLADAA